MNYTELFNELYPNFFEEESIRTMPAEQVFTELIMDLRGDIPDVSPLNFSDGITFGEYHGKLSELCETVRCVDEEWVRYFKEGDRFYCAFDGKKIVAFCCLDDMGQIQRLHIGGPGCVGTVPEYRRRGIGLEMVRLATETLRRDGFDLSWIHYTHLADWYMKLGYQPVLRWNSGGILQNSETL